MKNETMDRIINTSCMVAAAPGIGTVLAIEKAKSAIETVAGIMLILATTPMFVLNATVDGEENLLADITPAVGYCK